MFEGFLREKTRIEIRFFRPRAEIVTPPEPEGEVLKEILQMAEESARRSMDNVRPQMARAIRGVFEKQNVHR